MKEQQAIALLKHGDLGGLEMLVRRYYFPAVRASYLIVQDRQQAEDIVQDAFLHACEKIGQLAMERFGPWFYRSVVNASIKELKSQKKSFSLDAGPEDQSLSLEELLGNQRASPEDLVEGNELRQTVWQALQRLTPNQRVAVVLKYYLEMSEADMAGELNKPLSTIKWWLRAAKERLHDLLNPLRSSIHTPESHTTQRFPEHIDSEYCDER